jgi:hypothetical protein
VLIGLSGHAGATQTQLRYIGCGEADSTDPDRRNCLETGLENNAQFPAYVELTNANTFTVGPSSATSGTLYLSLMAKLSVGFGSFRSLNPVPADQFVSLGVVELIPAAGPPSPPTLTFSLIGSIFGGSPFQRTLTEPDLGTDTLLGTTKAILGGDPDNDNFGSDWDICPFISNPNQRDDGGVESPLNLEGADSDGIGNRCQCAAVDNDGIVRADDASAILDIIVGEPGSGTEGLCSVEGGPGCDVVDWVITERQRFGVGPNFVQDCVFANP